MNIENDRGLSIDLLGDAPGTDTTDVFCGNGCGFKCKRTAYERACHEAEKLAKQLGTGWTGRVWENCGWHFDAGLSVGGDGIATVRAITNGSSLAGTYTIDGFYAELRPETPNQIFSAKRPRTRGVVHPGFVRFDDPREAVRDAVAAARVIASRVTAVADEVEAAIGDTTLVEAGE